MTKQKALTITNPGNGTPVTTTQEFDDAFASLSPKQQAFIANRLSHSTDIETCKYVDIDKGTAIRWKEEPAFAFCYAYIYDQLRIALREKVLVSLPDLVSDDIPDVWKEAVKRYKQDSDRGEVGLSKLLQEILRPFVAATKTPAFVQQINVNEGPRDFPANVVNAESAKRGLEPLKEE